MRTRVCVDKESYPASVFGYLSFEMNSKQGRFQSFKVLCVLQLTSGTAGKDRHDLNSNCIPCLALQAIGRAQQIDTHRYDDR